MNDKHHIFSQLKETLHSHQEEYVPGAWEEFVKKRKRRRAVILFWRLSGAAAILLLLIGLFWLKITSPVKNEKSQIALQHPTRSLAQPSTGGHQALHAGNATAQKNQLTQNSVLPASVIAHSPATATDNKTTGNNAIVTAFPKQKDNSDRKDNYNADNKQQAVDTSASRPALVNTEEKKTEVKKYALITKPIYDSLMGHHTIDLVKKEKKNLSYAAIVSPALGGQKLNFGAGFEIAYPITGNLSVSSGVAYSSLHAENNGDNSGSLARQLQGANLDVSGFEVPLGLTYKTKSGFYATAGVLAMTVIADHLEYNYLVQRTVAMLNATPSGASYQTMSLVSSRQTETSQEKINNYLGFYQFSAGQKATIGHKEFNLGPFVKLPFGSVSNENIKLMQAGIRLGIGF
ncbi:MAG: hypothetical protein JWQ79_3500 [Mucilaginibacter sp.]|nr:hypothetical protein [Mucilaginibacter sp.]